MAHDPVKAEYWRTHVNAWRASGLSQRAYSARHELRPHRLFYWARRHPVPERPFTLVPITVGGGAGGLTLHGAGWRLEFAQPPAADWLAQLLGRLS